MVPYNEPIELAITVAVLRRFDDLELGLGVCTAGGFELASSLSIDAVEARSIKPGRYEYLVRLPGLRLAPGSYYLGLASDRREGRRTIFPWPFILTSPRLWSPRPPLSTNDGVP